MRPSQKLGMERLSSVNTRAAWSIQVFRYTAESRPAGTPIRIEITSDKETSASVVGNRQISSSTTRVLL